MNPCLDKNQVTVFGFKLNVYIYYKNKNVHTSNWLAIGVCNLSIV